MLCKGCPAVGTITECYAFNVKHFTTVWFTAINQSKTDHTVTKSPFIISYLSRYFARSVVFFVLILTLKIKKRIYVCVAYKIMFSKSFDEGNFKQLKCKFHV